MSWFNKIIEEIKGSEDFADIKTSSWRDFVNGNIFVKKFFRKQYPLLIMIAILLFVYVDNRYYCEQQTKRKVQLETELQDLKYENLTISADLMRLNRQSNVERMINERGIEVKESKTPPILIK
jgi:hypothetical protein